MLSFINFVREAFFGTIQPYRVTAPADIHKNPSRAELIKMTHQSDNHSVRGLLHSSGDAYFWDSNRALHHDVASHLEKQGVEGMATHISVTRERGKPPTVTHYKDHMASNKEHPYAAKHFADHKHDTYEGNV